jgi:branched-chain amino acid transport system ATP-binding protein
MTTSTESTETTDTDPRPILLEVRDVVVHYGRIEALHGVSLKVHEGELVTLLGSNGAGKTTMMRVRSGSTAWTSRRSRLIAG